MLIKKQVILKYFFIIFGIVFFCYGPTKVSAALIAHWKFDEGTGTTPADSSGNNITGTFTSTQPTWSSDVPSGSFTNPYSLDFSRTGDAVYFSWPSGLNFNGTASRSFSFWYKPTGDGETASGNYDRIMSWSGDSFEIAGTLGDVAVHRLAFYDGTWRDTGYDMTPGTWYHITFTYDGTNVKLYVDDTVKFSGTSSGRDVNGTIYIGLRYTGDEGINGRIDDFRIYDVALTDTQIANLTGGSGDPDTAPDSTAPVISSVDSTVNSSGATVTWTTNEAASTKLVYSLNTSYSSSTTETDTSTRVTSHSKTLSGLLSCTTYNYKAVSADAANNYATSTAASFTTSGCSGNATPSSATSTAVTVSSAGSASLTDSSRTLSVSTPVNFTSTSSSVVIQIKALTSSTVLGSIGKPSTSLNSAATKVFDVKAIINNTTELDSFSSPVTVSYTFTDADLIGLDRSTLVMYHYANNAWSQLSSCSTSGNTITCSASHFSVFAVFAQAYSAGSGLPPEAYFKPVIPTGGLTLAFNKISGTNYNVKSNAGKDVKYIALSTDPEFNNVGLILYNQSINWEACPLGVVCPTGQTKVYAKFYTSWGQQSSVLSALVDFGKHAQVSEQVVKVCPYFVKYAKQGNSNAEVKKIKVFLNTFENAGLTVSQTYDAALTKAVKNFQTKYSDKILTPWGFTKPTGWWYQSTMKTANDIAGCPTSVKLDNGKILP